MELGLAGQVVVVTGGSAGIGLECARTLVAEGAFVAICARDPQRLAAAAEELGRDAPGRVSACVADVTRTEDVRRLFREVAAARGRLDGLVNNAGEFDQGAFDDLEESDWDRVMQLKLMGAVRCCREALPAMRAQGSGSIVNVSGIAGLEPGDANPHVGAVNAALLALTKGLSRTYAPFGIRVNAVTPGSTRTRRYELRASYAARRQGVSLEEARRRLDQRLPLGRPVEPAEVGRLLALLLSGVLPSLTGQNVVIDAGLSHRI